MNSIGWSWAFVLLSVSSLLCACSYTKAIDPVMKNYARGDLDAAVKHLGKDPPRRRDRLIWLLERGKALQDAGRFESSGEALDEAERLIEDYFQKATIRGSQELFATLVNQYARDYEPTYADAILINVLQALNHLALGEIREAGVYLRAAHNRQQEAEQAYSSQIESREEQLQDTYDRLNTNAFEAGRGYVSPAYADFQNPLANYLRAMVDYIEGDTANANVDARLVQEMVPDNRYASQKMLSKAKLAVSGRGPNQVFILFENGMAPHRKPVKVPYGTPKTGVSLIALPRLAFTSPLADSMRIKTDGTTMRTQTIASIQSIMASEFEARLPIVILRTSLALAAKEGLTYAAGEKAGATGILAGSAYKLLTSQIDDRTWRTLPAEYQIAQMDYPSESELRLRLDGPSSAHLVLPLPDASVSLVWVRAINGHVQARSFPIDARRGSQ